MKSLRWSYTLTRDACLWKQLQRYHAVAQQVHETHVGREGRLEQTLGGSLLCYATPFRPPANPTSTTTSRILLYPSSFLVCQTIAPVRIVAAGRCSCAHGQRLKVLGVPHDIYAGLVVTWGLLEHFPHGARLARQGAREAAHGAGRVAAVHRLKPASATAVVDVATISEIKAGLLKADVLVRIEWGVAIERGLVVKGVTQGRVQVRRHERGWLQQALLVQFSGVLTE